MKSSFQFAFILLFHQCPTHELLLKTGKCIVLKFHCIINPTASSGKSAKPHSTKRIGLCTNSASTIIDAATHYSTAQDGFNCLLDTHYIKHNSFESHCSQGNMISFTFLVGRHHYVATRVFCISQF